MQEMKLNRYAELVLLFDDRSIAGAAGDACCDDTVADGVQLLVGGFLQASGGRLAVDGVDHDLLGGDGFDGLEPRADILIACVVDGF